MTGTFLYCWNLQSINHCPGVCAILLDRAINFTHYGGSEYQAEVALLSRNKLIQGDKVHSEPTDINPYICRSADCSNYPCVNSYLTGFGGHIMISGTNAVGKIAGVELYRMGQTNVLARYPFHLHLVKKMDIIHLWLIVPSIAVSIVVSQCI